MSESEKAMLWKSASRVHEVLIFKDFGSQDLSQNRLKNDLKIIHIFGTFLDGSWGPKSLKMSTSCTRETHFHKIAFSDSGRFFEAKTMKKGSQNGSKMVYKFNQKIRRLFDRFWTYLWGLLGALWGSKYQQKSSSRLRVFLEAQKGVVEPPVEIQGQPRGIWRPAGMPGGCPWRARAIGP